MTVLNLADDLRLGSLAVDKVYCGTTQVWARDTGATPVNAQVTIAAGKVSSDVTNFVVPVNLADMPTDWWLDVTSNGGNIRVKQGGTVIPFHLERIAPALGTGRLWLKANLSAASANVFTIDKTGTGLLANTDTNGRNAVWSDYDGVWSFEESPDGGRTIPNWQGNSARDAVFIGTEQWRTDGTAIFSTSSYAEEIQGLAHNATTGNYVVTATDKIRKYDAAWTLLATNATALADPGVAGMNHIGDPCIKDGELFVGMRSDSAAAGQHDWIVVFDAETLAYKRKYNLNDLGTTASITFNPNDGLFYCPNYDDGSKWWKFDTSFNLVGTVTLGTATGSCQGLHYLNGYMYASVNTVGNGLYRFNLDGSNRIAASPSNNPGNTPQGLTSDSLFRILTARSTLSGGTVVPFDLNYKITPGVGVEILTASSTTGWRASGLPKRTTWTTGASAAPSQNTANAAITSYSDNSSTDGNRSTMGQRSTGTFADWNSTDTWLEKTPALTVGVRCRINKVHDGTAKRIMYVNGAGVTDTTVAQRPGSTGDTLFIWCGVASLGSIFRGRGGLAYLRNGELSPAWIAAETASWENPSSFYTVAPV